MKRLLIFGFLMFCLSVVAPSIKAQDYDGPVYKQQIPVNRESRGVDIRHSSVNWGGETLAWVSSLKWRFHGSYSKSSPRIIIRNTKTSLIRNNKVNKRR